MSTDRAVDPNFPLNAAEKYHLVKEICQPLQLRCDTLKTIKQLFLKEIKIGLAKKTQGNAEVKCLPTYIQKLSTGCENGKCLVMDISGSDFYVLLLTFNGQKEYKKLSTKYFFPDHLLGGPTIHLVNFMVECLSNFVKKLSLHLENLPLAISLAFYARQDDIPLWKKNFNIPNDIATTIVQMLREAVECRGDIKISNYVLVNDTAAVLMSCAWKNDYSKIGVVVDKGCNACYLEKIKNIFTLQKTRTETTIPTMIVNTEWAFFGDNGSLDFIRTAWDLQIDKLSATKTERTFEKMVSGRYLGALVRLILLECIKSGALLGGNITSELNKANSFRTSFIVDIEAQREDTYYKTQHILRLLGYKNAENIDCDIVRKVCEIVTRRSIYLVAATLACLIDCIGDPYLVVGMEGNICRYRPHYREDLQLKLRQLVRPEYKFDLVVPESGRGCGTALVAFGMATVKRRLRSKSPIIVNPALANMRAKRNGLSKKRKRTKNLCKMLC